MISIRVLISSLFFSRFVALLIPQMLVHSYKSFIKEASTSPFTIEWYMKMQDTINANSNAHAHFTLQDKQFHNQPSLNDMSSIFEYFYKQHRVMIIVDTSVSSELFSLGIQVVNPWKETRVIGKNLRYFVKSKILYFSSYLIEVVVFVSVKKRDECAATDSFSRSKFLQRSRFC